MVDSGKAILSKKTPQKFNNLKPVLSLFLLHGQQMSLMKKQHEIIKYI